MSKDLYTLAEIAERTGWSKDSLRRACAAGRLEHHFWGGQYYLSEDQYRALLESTRRSGDSTKPLTEPQRREIAMTSSRAANVARMRRRGAA